MASMSSATCGLAQNTSLLHHQTSSKTQTHKAPGGFLHFIDRRKTIISGNGNRNLLFFSNNKKTNQKSRVCAIKEAAGSSETLLLTAINVDFVLEEVRPYLISDGGNVDVVSVEDGVVSLKLQGACGSCPSSTTTMKMGIERVLKEKFGDAIKDIRQVFDEEQNELTVEAVNGHLDILRPAITNYGGSVQVTSIDGGDCHVKYKGPESIGSGIKAAIKEKFPDIVNVVLSS